MAESWKHWTFWYEEYAGHMHKNEYMKQNLENDDPNVMKSVSRSILWKTSAWKGRPLLYSPGRQDQKFCLTKSVTKILIHPYRSQRSNDNARAVWSVRSAIEWGCVESGRRVDDMDQWSSLRYTHQHQYVSRQPEFIVRLWANKDYLQKLRKFIYKYTSYCLKNAVYYKMRWQAPSNQTEGGEVWWRRFYLLYRRWGTLTLNRWTVDRGNSPKCLRAEYIWRLYSDLKYSVWREAVRNDMESVKVPYFWHGLHV